MQHDWVIRDALVADGTGREPFVGDVAVDGADISAVGRVNGRGREEIDAAGRLVTPGFIDLHTHLDAQVGWDPACTPVSWHGVTTALLGNCGVSFAPCRPSDRALLAAMMETVEDIPRQAILEGLSWDWEDYGGYLDAVEALGPGVNICGLVGHSALRFYVMGDRAVDEQATEAERAEMARIAGAAIDRGAAGFSTNRFAPHVLPDGRPIPGTFAEPIELLEIGREVAARGALMQAVGAHFDVLEAIGDQPGSRVLFSYGAGHDMATAHQRRSALESLVAGRDVTAMAQIRGSGLVLGLQSMLPFAGRAWARLRSMDLAGRLTALADEATVRELVAQAQELDFRPILDTGIEHLYFMGDGVTPDYDAGVERNVLAMAEAAGEHWSETFIRLSRETDGRALFTLRLFNRDIDALGHLLSSPACLPGLGDAGAHVSQVMDAGWATFVLSYWVRQRGIYPLEQAVHRLSGAPARILGLSDRGIVAPGMRADLNVIDLERLTELQPRIVHDFPGGAPRFIQRATGYAATFVNGVCVLRDDELTGRRAGRVLRHRAPLGVLAH